MGIDISIIVETLSLIALHCRYGEQFTINEIPCKYEYHLIHDLAIEGIAERILTSVRSEKDVEAEVQYAITSNAVFTYKCPYSGRDLVLSLPRQWLIAHIEEHAEAVLQHNDYEEYQGLLQVYEELDNRLALELARRALNHHDPDIREVGEKFLERAGVRS